MLRILVSIALLMILTACNKKPQVETCPLQSEHMQTQKLSELNSEYRALVEAASASLDKAYTPYFRFNVGAALLTDDGEIITGNNVENAAGSSICAERSAIVRANAMGKRKYKAIAIIALAHDASGAAQAVTEPVAPCGACRQFIYEFAQVADYDIDVIMSNTDKTKIVIKKISELLPMAFGPKDLV